MTIRVWHKCNITQNRSTIMKSVTVKHILGSILQISDADRHSEEVRTKRSGLSHGATTSPPSARNPVFSLSICRPGDIETAQQLLNDTPVPLHAPFTAYLLSSSSIIVVATILPCLPANTLLAVGLN